MERVGSSSSSEECAWVISIFKAPPLIVTLGSNYVFMGIAVIITEGKSIVGLPAAFNSLGQGFLFGVIPVQFVKRYWEKYLVFFHSIISSILHRIGKEGVHH